MKTSDIIIVHPDSDAKIEALKAFMKALKIKFEITKKKSYDPKFVAKIQESREEYKKGDYTVIKTDDLWKE